MKEIKLLKNEVLVLRSVNKQLQSRNWFQYPKKWLVVCKDWKNTKECWNGLHWLEFWNSLTYDIVWDYSDKFLIIKVKKSDWYIDLWDKVKFKKWTVEIVFDDYNKSLEYIKQYYPDKFIAACRDIQKAGYSSTQKAGDYSFHCLRWDNHIIRPWCFSVISIIGDGENPNVYQFMYWKDFKKWETLNIIDWKITRYTNTPDKITKLKYNEIFVFWANWQGNHCWWAAKIAKDKFWAIEWQSEWLQGQSYAINTMDWIEKIKEWLLNLYKTSCKETTTIFFLTKIWCWIAGYKEDYIIELVRDVDFPANVILPKWRDN